MSVTYILHYLISIIGLGYQSKSINLLIQSRSKNTNIYIHYIAHDLEPRMHRPGVQLARLR